VAGENSTLSSLFVFGKNDILKKLMKQKLYLYLHPPVASSEYEK